MDLPEEIIYKVLSYLPYNKLVQLDLSNKQYWNIYRTRRANCHWDNNIVWRERLSGTHEMVLQDKLYIHSLLSLVEGYPLTFIPKIPVENTTVNFQCYLDGYVWHCLGEKVNLSNMKQILNERDKSLTFFKVDNFYCDVHILNIFNKYILKYIWEKIPEDVLDYCCKEYVSEDESSINETHQKPQNNLGKKLIRFPDDDEIDVHLVLYLNEQTIDLNSIKLDFEDEIKIGSYIIWKVIKIVENQKTDIGRAVLSPELHNMMNYDVGIGLFAKKDKVIGLGNFNYRKADKEVLKLLPKGVFETYNFVIVKK